MSCQVCLLIYFSMVGQSLPAVILYQSFHGPDYKMFVFVFKKNFLWEVKRSQLLRFIQQTERMGELML